MLDSFTYIVKVTRSIISTANVPARLEIPTRGTLPAAPGLGNAAIDPPDAHGGGVAAASAPTRKRGRPVGSVDIVPRKRRDSKAQNDPLIINTMNPSHEIVSDYSYVQESMLAYLGDTSDPMLMLENKEISLMFTDAHSMMKEVP